MRWIYLGLLCLVCAACSGDRTDTQSNDDGRLSVVDGHLVSAAPLSYTFNFESNIRLIGPDHRTDTFNGTPFQISRAAFLDGDIAVMIHAEKVQDGSGASNYDNLPAVSWPTSEFRSAGDHCITLTEDDVSGEPDPEWLREHGFEPVGTLLFGQYFLSSSDYNDEIVVSLIQRISSCSDDALNDRLIDKLKGRLVMIPRN